jgi:N-methylhydantoinase A
MRAEALAVVRAGAPDADLTEQRVAYMRYYGQGHEVVVALPDGDLAPDGANRLQGAFDRAYTQLYRRIIPGAEVEVLSWGLNLAAAGEAVATLGIPEPVEAPEAAGRRRLFDAASGQWQDIAFYLRADLAPGMTLAGPALIVEEQT